MDTPELPYSFKKVFLKFFYLTKGIELEKLVHPSRLGGAALIVCILDGKLETRMANIVDIGPESVAICFGYYDQTITLEYSDYGSHWFALPDFYSLNSVSRLFKSNGRSEEQI